MSINTLNNPKFQEIDENGEPLDSGKLYTFEAGTTTLKTTYSDRDLAVPNANPIILDSSGQATIYGTGSYKFKMDTALDVTRWTVDNIATGVVSQVGISNYSNSLSAAIAAIGSDETSLVLDGGDITLTQSDVIPDNITLVRNNGVVFSGAYTLTLNCGMEGDLVGQWFDPATVTIHADSKPKVEAIYPEMFGAAGDGVTDDTTAIQAALDMNGRITLIPNRNYLITAAITQTTERATINGNGSSITALNLAAYMVVFGDESVLVTNNKIEDVVFNVNGTTTGAINFNACGNSSIKNCRFETTGTAGVAILSKGNFFLKIDSNRFNGTFAKNILYQKAESIGYKSNESLIINNWFKMNNNASCIGVHIQDGSQGITSFANYYEDIEGYGIYADTTTGSSPNDLGAVRFHSLNDEFEDCVICGEFDNAGAIVTEPVFGPDVDDGFNFNGSRSRLVCTSVTNACANFEATVASGAQNCFISVPDTNTAISDSGTYTTMEDPGTGHPKRNVIVHTSASFNVVWRDIGRVHNNLGAATIVTGSLPEADASYVGAEFIFHRTNDTYALRIDPTATDRIRFSGRLGAVGEYLSIDSNGGSVTLRLASTAGAAIWDVVDHVGNLSWENFDGFTAEPTDGTKDFISTLYTTNWIDTSAGGGALTMGDGTEGQLMYLYMTVDGGTATVTPDSLSNGTTIEFDYAGDSAFLRFTNSKWTWLGGTARLAFAATAYTPTNVSADRSFDANAAAGAITSPPTQSEVENIRDAVLELADVVGTMVSDLQVKGIL